MSVVKSRFIFVFFLVVQSIAVKAAVDCPRTVNQKDIDLRSELPPLRNQGMNNCFAMVAETLINHRLYQMGRISNLRDPKQLVSPTALALQAEAESRNYYFKKYQNDLPKIRELDGQIESLSNDAQKIFEKLKPMPEDSEEKKNLRQSYMEVALKIQDLNKQRPENLNFDTGGVLGSVLRNKEIKWCSEASVSGLDHFPDESRSLFNPTVEGTKISQKSTPDLGARINKFLTAYAENDKPKDLCQLASDIQPIFPGLIFDDILKILRESLGSDPLQKFIDSACKGIPGEDRKHSFQEAGTGIIEFKFPDMIEVLNNRNVVGIDINAKIFNPNQKGPAQHSVTVVGKKHNCETGSTDYIIRNSWGPDSCEADRAEYVKSTRPDQEMGEPMGSECVPPPANATADSVFNCIETSRAEHIKRNKPPFSCDQGYYIVSESVLEKTVTSVTYLDYPGSPAARRKQK